ncbi:MAG: hypothetical protein H0T46_04470 [Deltaproteobacteria bacterium]|nr:hypothetical protein [Deltaproteobacteria bacterium]
MFVATRFGKLEAFAKDTGAPAWSKTIMGARDLGIAMDPSGGVTVTSDAQVSSYGATGSVRWSVPSSMLGLVELDRVAQAADGSIAVLGSDGSLDLRSAQKIVMLEPGGVLRWTQPLGTRSHDRVTSMVTDGVHIVVAGDYGRSLGFDPSAATSDDSAGFLSTVGATGVVSTFTVGGTGTQRLYVTSMTTDSTYVRATSFDTENVPSLEMPGVDVDGNGNGVAILEVAR